MDFSAKIIDGKAISAEINRRTAAEVAAITKDFGARPGLAVVLVGDDPLKVVAAFDLGKRTMRIVRENLFWAFFYNILGIPLAAGVFHPLFSWRLSPVFGALAMAASSLCVVTNALRLNRSGRRR